MCSKMQKSRARARNGRRLRSRPRRITTTSPGSTSRSKLAPIRSSAQVSLATTQAPSRRPSESGRKPCGSRAAISASPVSITRLKAPFTRESASIRRSSWLCSRERASSCTITSLSAVVLKIAPRPSSSRRIAQRVDQVAVVRDRDRAAVGGGAEGLRVGERGCRRPSSSARGRSRGGPAASPSVVSSKTSATRPMPR